MKAMLIRHGWPQSNKPVRIPVIVNGIFSVPNGASRYSQRRRAIHHDRPCSTGAAVDLSRDCATFLPPANICSALHERRLRLAAWPSGLKALCFYGEPKGVRSARKHIQWYCQDHQAARRSGRSQSLTDAATASRRRYVFRRDCMQPDFYVRVAKAAFV